MSLSRVTGIAALALTFVVSASARAQAPGQDAGVPVVAMIYAPGQQPVPDATTIGALEADCPTSDVDPALYGPGGAAEPGTVPTTKEWALATVLSSTNPDCLPTPIPISAISQVTVLESDGQPDLNAAAQVTSPDLTLPSDFADPSAWPVFWDAGSAVIYERPSRSSSDDNAADQVIVQPGQTLQFDVFEDSAPATVRVQASDTSVTPGTRVNFTASLPGGSGGESFQWAFDGGAPATSGPSASATFASAGVYEVTVQATGAVDGLGEIDIDVGSVPAATGTTSTPTGPATGSSGTPGTGTRKPGRKPTGATHTTTGEASNGAVTSATAPPPGGSRPDAGEGSAHAGARAGGAAGRRRRVREPPASGPAAPRAKPETLPVRGRLLVTSGIVVGGRSAASESGGAPRVNRRSAGPPWAALAGGLLVLALLGLGAGRELRSLRLAP